MGWELGQVVKKNRIKNRLVNLTLCPSWHKRKQVLCTGCKLAPMKHIVEQVFSSTLTVLKSSCLRPPIPWPRKGGLVIPTVAEIL